VIIHDLTFVPTHLAHRPPITLARPDNRPPRPARTPTAPRHHDPGSSVQHTRLQGCPAARTNGAARGPCLCIAWSL
jgi:hypothetical protein